MRRLVKLHVIRAGHHHHDHATVLAFLDRAAELRTFRPQLLHRRLDVIAHERDSFLRDVLGWKYVAEDWDNDWLIFKSGHDCHERQQVCYVRRSSPPTLFGNSGSLDYLLF
jgi:hypothetical protein